VGVRRRWSPVLVGVVERRLLVNYRADPEVVARILPAPFRPQVVSGSAVAGICLIRLGQLRPKGVPRRLGFRSENAAHRIAVAWDTDEGVKSGVYIPRRDTNALVNVAVGGRLFPGTHHRARFSVHETPNELCVGFAASDGSTEVDARVTVAATLDGSHLFGDLDAASTFFEHGSLGYSATRDEGRFDGLELRTAAWAVEAATIDSVRSSFFADQNLFPPGSAELDCALVMRDIPVSWHPIPDRVEATEGTGVTGT
jgi:hypothetical protein